MLKVTLSGLMSRKLRLMLSATAVVLGVAFVAVSLVLSDSLNHAFSSFIGTANERTSATVDATTDRSTGQFVPIPAPVLEEVRTVPGVADAQGALSGFARVLPAHGNQHNVASAGTALSWIDSPDLNPLRLTTGHAPQEKDEVVIDPTSAKELG